MELVVTLVLCVVALWGSQPTAIDCNAQQDFLASEGYQPSVWSIAGLGNPFIHVTDAIQGLLCTGKVVFMVRPRRYPPLAPDCRK